MSLAILLQCKDIEEVSFYLSVPEKIQVGAMVIEYCGKWQSKHNLIGSGLIMSVQNTTIETYCLLFIVLAYFWTHETKKISCKC